MRYSLVRHPAVVVAIVTLGSCQPAAPNWQWDLNPRPPTYRFIWNDPTDPYFQTLREETKLDSLVAGASSDLERVYRVAYWVHNLWEHSSASVKFTHDPLTVIKMAREGARFDCRQYANVTSGCLNALGIQARMVGLFARNYHEDEVNSFHVVVEAFLRDQEKWVMVDAQANAVPMLNGSPLNAAQLKTALAQGARGLEVHGLSPRDGAKYIKWIDPLMFYIQFRRDNSVPGTRYFTGSAERITLVPVGVAWPQDHFGVPLKYMRYTSAIYAVYVKPR